MWGSNVPVTRTPDAHFMAEARYRGQKVITVSPDYADNTKFADEWLAVHPGTDGALAIAMGHVILREFLVDRRTARFVDYMKTYSDSAYLVSLTPRGDAYVPDKFLTADALPGSGPTVASAAFKPVLLDQDGGPSCPTGRSGTGSPRPTPGSGTSTSRASTRCCRSRMRPTTTGASVAIDMPRFDVAPETDEIGEEHTGGAGVVRRGVPVRMVAGQLVTTVFDLLLAQYGVGRDELNLPGDWPTGYDDASSPGTPAWQEEITSVPAPGRRTDRPRVRAERRGLRRPLDDPDGRRHQPLVPLRHHLPRLPRADHDDRLPGRQRRRLGALRGPGEGAPAHRLRRSTRSAWTGCARRAR